MAAVVLRGWPAIAKRLGVCVDTALAYARLKIDPLPIMMVRGEPQAELPHVDEWRARRQGGVMPDGSTLERIDGVKAIARRQGVDRRTVHKIMQDKRDPLPVMKTGRRRWAYASALRDWDVRQVVPLRAVDDTRSARGRMSTKKQRKPRL